MSPMGICIKNTINTTISVSVHNQYYGINPIDTSKFNFFNFLCLTQILSPYLMLKATWLELKAFSPFP